MEEDVKGLKAHFLAFLFGLNLLEMGRECSQKDTQEEKKVLIMKPFLLLPHFTLGLLLAGLFDG